MIEKQVFIDFIDEKSINIAVIEEGVEGEWRASYMNDDIGRREVERYFIEEVNLPELYEEVMRVWGNEPTVFYESSPPIPFEIIKEMKVEEIKQLCQKNIIDGITIDIGKVGKDGIPMGELHYYLDLKKQDYMKILYEAIKNGAQEVIWRDESRVSHEVYTAKEFMILFTACTTHILTCQLRSDSLEEYLKTLTDQQEISELNWNTELPESILQQEQILFVIQAKALGIPIEGR